MPFHSALTPYSICQNLLTNPTTDNWKSINPIRFLFLSLFPISKPSMSQKGDHMKSCIGFTPIETSRFEDKKHIRNFGRYLISDSRRLSRNQRTSFNLITVKNHDFHNEDPSLASRTLSDVLKKHDLNETNCYNDLTHFAFMFKYETYWISNFISGSKSNKPIETFDSAAASIFISRLYKNSMENAQKNIIDALRDSDGILPFDDVSIEAKHHVNRLIMQVLKDLHPSNAVLSVIHHDQDRTSHIHRLIKK